MNYFSASNDKVQKNIFFIFPTIFSLNFSLNFTLNFTLNFSFLLFFYNVLKGRDNKRELYKPLSFNQRSLSDPLTIQNDFYLILRMIKTTRTILDYERFARRIKKKGRPFLFNSMFDGLYEACQEISIYELSETVIQTELRSLLRAVEQFDIDKVIGSLSIFVLLSYYWAGGRDIYFPF